MLYAPKLSTCSKHKEKETGNEEGSTAAAKRCKTFSEQELAIGPDRIPEIKVRASNYQACRKPEF
jgi:hypothetical protein